jgi:hypothetical protein
MEHVGLEAVLATLLDTAAWIEDATECPAEQAEGCDEWPATACPLGSPPAADF